MPIPFPKTIDSKPIVEITLGVWTTENNELVVRTTPNTPIIDLTEPSLKIQQDQPFTGVYLVNDETSMRIDVISQITLGNTINTEKMLKFNDISNPFTIDTGDLLFIPDLVYANINMAPNAGRDAQKYDIRNQYIDPEKSSKLDPTLGKFNERNKPKAPDPSKTTPALPPNFANVGDKEIEIKGGKIFFGPNVSKNKNECDEPISKSEFLAKLIKNRINK